MVIDASVTVTSSLGDLEKMTRNAMTPANRAMTVKVARMVLLVSFFPFHVIEQVIAKGTGKYLLL